MGVAIVGWGRRVMGGSARTVPSPADGSAQKWWWDVLAAECRISVPPVSLRSSCFPRPRRRAGPEPAATATACLIPATSATNPSQGSTPTRYGSPEQLRRLVASAHASGLDVYLDVVLHQLNGENGGPGVFHTSARMATRSTVAVPCTRAASARCHRPIGGPIRRRTRRTISRLDGRRS